MKDTCVKDILLVTVLLFVVQCAYAQETKNENEVVKTKMDSFTSRTGVIRKFTDFNLSNLKGSYLEAAETRIRKVAIGTESLYFYQIEKQGKYGNSTASIEYTDLLEILKALLVLMNDANKDLSLNPDYLENKFVTIDGFQVGYYISKAKLNWYITLEKYGSEKTLFVNNPQILAQAFMEGKEKIELLMK